MRCKGGCPCDLAWRGCGALCSELDTAFLCFSWLLVSMAAGQHCQVQMSVVQAVPGLTGHRGWAGRGRGGSFFPRQFLPGRQQASTSLAWASQLLQEGCFAFLLLLPRVARVPWCFFGGLRGQASSG